MKKAMRTYFEKKLEEERAKERGDVIRADDDVTPKGGVDPAMQEAVRKYSEIKIEEERKARESGEIVDHKE